MRSAVRVTPTPRDSGGPRAYDFPRASACLKNGGALAGLLMLLSTGSVASSPLEPSVSPTGAEPAATVRTEGVASALERLSSGDAADPAPNAEAEARFGRSVSIEGNCAVVGASGENGNDGAVYAFHRVSESEWRLVQRIVSTSAAGTRGRFGTALQLSGLTLIVAEYSGKKVHAYRASSNCSWVHEQAIEIPETPDSIARFGDSLAVGTEFEQSGRGRVYLWERNFSGEWMDAGSLLAPGTGQDHFGAEVALHGNVLAVSAPRGFDERGTVYVYGRTGGSWFRTATLIPPASTSGMRFFGRGLAMNAGALVVGMTGLAQVNEPNTSRVYIYEPSGAGWQQVFEIVPGSTEWNFGAEVAVAGPTAQMPLSVLASSNFGQVKLYQKIGSTWMFRSNLHSGSGGDVSFGSALAITSNGNRALVGEPLDDVDGYNDSGSAHVYAIGSTGSATFERFLTGNRPPVVEALPAQVLEDSSIGYNFVVTDPDTSVGALKVEVTSSNQTVISDESLAASLVRNGSLFQLTLSPQPNANGIVTLTISASDQSLTTTATSRLTVVAVNDRPFATYSTISAHPAGTTGPQVKPGFVSSFGRGAANESAQQVHSYSVTATGGSDNVVETIELTNDDVLRYTLLPDASGAAQFEVVLRDTGGTRNGGVDLSIPHRFTIEVNADPAREVDLAVTIDNGTDAVTVGEDQVYSVVVRNLGGAAAAGSRLSMTADPGVSIEGYDCQAITAAAVCPDEPTQDDTREYRFELDIPAGGALNFDMLTTIDAPGADFVEFGATANESSGLIDTNAENNSDEDFDAVLPVPRVFQDGFEFDPLAPIP